MGVVAPGEKKK